jgi:hypothetical protein
MNTRQWLHHEVQVKCNVCFEVRDIAQAVGRWLLAAVSRVCARSVHDTCEICVVNSGTETGFYPSSLVFSCHYHSTAVPLRHVLTSSH